MAKCRRSATFRSVPWGSAVCLVSAVVSYFPPFPISCWGTGAPGAKNIMKYGMCPPKYVGFQGGLAKCRRPVPWRSAVSLFCSVMTYFLTIPNLVMGRGYPVPRNHIWNSGGIFRNMAGSIDVYRDPGAMSLFVALLGVSRDWCPFSTLWAHIVFLCVPGVSDSRYPITAARSGKRN